MLSKIIQGWKSYSQHAPRSKEEAERCFSFLCKTYTSAPAYQRWGNYPNIHAKKEGGRIRKGILDLFQEHLGPHSSWGGNRLDSWIIREGTPDEITKVLLHARIRLGGIELAKKMIRLSSPQG